MTSATLRRLAVWTPLPPQRGQVALHAAGLLPELARHVEVIVVVDDWLAPLASPPPGCGLMAASEFVARGAPADLAVYHMADDFDGHAYIHDALVRTPGLVVLHDTCLSDYYRTVHVRDPNAYRAELWRNHGGHVSEHDDRRTMLLRRIVGASLGLVVDSPGTAAAVRRRFPAASIDVVPPPLLARAPGADDLDVRAELGWDDDSFVVGTVGTLESAARPELSVAVATACRAVDQRVRLLVAGSAPDAAGVDRVDAAIEALGPAGAVLTTDPPPAVLDACLDACDLLLDLRSREAGLSNRVVQGLVRGLPAVVTDLPMFEHFDPRCCWRVPEDARQAVGAAAELVLRVVDRRVDQTEFVATAQAAAAASDPPAVATRLLQVAQATAARRPRLHLSDVSPLRPLNIHGDFLAATGLMEAGRQLTLALLDSPLDVRIHDIVSYGPTHSDSRAEPQLATVSRQLSPEGDHLWLANINEFPNVTEEALRSPGATGRVIALWFWELPRLPGVTLEHLQRVDEIWVASTFVRDTMRRHTTHPVHIIPMAIEPRLPVSFSRRDFDLPEGPLLYFFNFDAFSIVGRKNPFGVIEAFKRAFDPTERGRGARLVVKCTNLAPRQAFARALERAMDDIGGIVLSEDLERAEMNALLASIDVYVSLHRSEGFGFGMAEAMALGKPVVGTAFSGSADFLLPGVSCPVGYRVRPITDLDHQWWLEGRDVYPPGFTYWAEPDGLEAARWMRLLFEQPALRERIGRAAATHIAERYSPARARASVLGLLRRPAAVAA